MITLEDFQKLGSGSIVIWNPRNPIFRTVCEGPADDPRDPPHLSISFPIRRPSWTTRAYTTYQYSSIKNHILYTGKKKDQLFSEEELERILEMGNAIRPRWSLTDNMKRTFRCKGCTPRLSNLAKETLEAFRFANIR